MKVFFKDKAGKVSIRTDLDGIEPGSWQLIWMDIEGEAGVEVEAFCKIADLHPLSVESCRSHAEVPKVQAFPNHLFITWSFLHKKKGSEGLTAKNICMFMGDDFLLTVHGKELPELDDIRGRVEADDGNFYKDGVSAIVYSILDAAVDEYFPMVEDLTEKIDGYMDTIVMSDDVGDVKTILDLKQYNMTLRRAVCSHRDAVVKLARRDMPFVPSEVSLYMLDVYDHLARLASEVENNTDLISSSLDIHLNAVSNRLNVTMKRLTTIATIFMPLTFLVGLYGMNFKNMPELTWRYGYLFAWISLIVITIIMIAIAKWKQWF